MERATGRVETVSALFGRLLEALALLACALLFLMMLVICADVLLRNVALLPRMRGVEWSNEASEATLYLITMLAAPWLLRRGQHIRVDILLRAIPRRLAWYCEWACDVIALACCALMVAYGAKSALASHAAGSLSTAGSGYDHKQPPLPPRWKNTRLCGTRSGSLGPGKRATRARNEVF